MRGLGRRRDRLEQELNDEVRFEGMDPGGRTTPHLYRVCRRRADQKGMPRGVGMESRGMVRSGSALRHAYAAQERRRGSIRWGLEVRIALAGGALK